MSIGANAFVEFCKSKTPPCPQAWFSFAFAAMICFLFRASSPRAIVSWDTPAILATSAGVSIGLLFGEFSKRLRSVRRPWFSRAFAATICYSGRAGRWYGRCRRYGDMGREEIRRLCLNVWASPAVSPGGRAGCSDRHGISFRYVPLPTRFHPAGCMSRAGARLYPLTAFVHLPYSPTITRAISAGRKCQV